MTIKGFCRTNLDEYQREEWPSEFVSVHQYREWVVAKSGRRLMVHTVSHVMRRNDDGIHVPMVEVELHKWVPRQ